MAPFHLVRAKARREHFPQNLLRNSNSITFNQNFFKLLYIVSR